MHQLVRTEDAGVLSPCVPRPSTKEKDIEVGDNEMRKGKKKDWFGGKKKFGLVGSYLPNSLDRRMFYMNSYMLVMSLFFGSCVGFVGPIFACFTWAITGLFCQLFVLSNASENPIACLLTRLILIGVLQSSVLIYHLGTHKTIHLMERELWDSTLLSVDKTLLGNFFPEGQLALWADTSDWVGPYSLLGRFVTEILQLLYFSYYLWGNLFVIYLGWEYLVSCYKNGWRHDKVRWRKIQMLLLCFVGTFMLNFSINFVFPAVSPRIYLADRYQNELRGFWIGDLMRGAIKKGAANSYGAFPSGHVALTWVPALAASRLGYPVYGRICELAAAGITLATIFLRYHYFVDALGASLLIIFGLYFARLLGSSKSKLVVKLQQQNLAHAYPQTL